MLQITLQSAPSQRVSTVLASQNCQISLYQKPQGLFVDINVDGLDISTAVLARDGIALNPRDYGTFAGNLFLIDTQGSQDPTYDGLGSRYQLVYLTAAEYALIR